MNKKLFPLLITAITATLVVACRREPDPQPGYPQQQYPQQQYPQQQYPQQQYPQQQPPQQYPQQPTAQPTQPANTGFMGLPIPPLMGSGGLPIPSGLPFPFPAPQ